MIACPWCSTSHKEYQPVCERCGGPIPEPSVGAQDLAPQQAPPPDLPLPPAPPRPFSDGYAWRLLAGEGGAIAGGVVAGLGAIFALLGLLLTVLILTAFIGIPLLLLGGFMLVAGGAIFLWRYQRALARVAVLRRGLATTGEIVRVEQNLAYRVNRQHPWEVTYRFNVEWREFQGRMTTLATPGPQHQPGRPVTVLYLAEAPEQNALYPLP